MAVKYGLSDTALWILYLVSEETGSLTQQDLCRQSCFAKQTINTSVNRLVKNGLLELIPIPGTRNHKRVQLTPAGRELADRTTQRLKKAEEKAYGRFSEAELQMYLETTRRVTAYLREETEKLRQAPSGPTLVQNKSKQRKEGENHADHHHQP